MQRQLGAVALAALRSLYEHRLLGLELFGQDFGDRQNLLVGRGGSFLDACGVDPPGLHRFDECRVVAFILVGVRFGERRDRLVEDLAAAQIGGDRDPVAGLAWARASVQPQRRP